MKAKKRRGRRKMEEKEVEEVEEAEVEVRSEWSETGASVAAGNESE